MANKIYSLLIEARDAIFLSSQYASSLEEAVSQAKVEYIKINELPEGSEVFAGAKIGLYCIKTIGELTTENTEFKERKDSKNREESIIKKEHLLEDIDKIDIPVTDDIKKYKDDIIHTKNLKIKEIIENKDIEMYEKFKSLFSKNERKYIEEHLKK